MLVAYLGIVFLLGGSARPNVQSLPILRPLAIGVCGFGLATLPRAVAQHNRRLLLIAGAIVGLCILHVVPLPPTIWQALPGRALLIEIDRAAGIDNMWRPIALVPASAFNALFALAVPLGVLLLGLRLSHREKGLLLAPLIGLATLSGLLGILQVLGPPHGPLYLYAVTNPGSAPGLFANRNHAALLLACAFPMLAAARMRAQRSREKVANVAVGSIAAVLLALLLVTGSRAGLLLGTLAIAATLVAIRPAASRPQRVRVRFTRWQGLVVGIGLFFAIGAAAMMMPRAVAVQRLFAANQGEDLRFQVWKPIAEMGWRYFPVGSGVGSFVETYQIAEPAKVLSPNYLNHAHNDWLEVFVTTGLPGIAIAILATAGLLAVGCRAWQAPQWQDGDLARVGTIVIAIMALGSVVDYPLRVPSLAASAAIALVWMVGVERDLRGGMRHETNLGHGKKGSAGFR